MSLEKGGILGSRNSAAARTRSATASSFNCDGSILKVVVDCIMNCGVVISFDEVEGKGARRLKF